MAILVIFLTTLLCCIMKAGTIQIVTSLPNLNSTLLKPITLSGFSSGGAMATHFHVAHSSIVSSIGAFASSFYRCGRNGHLHYSLTCLKNLTEVSTSVKDAKNYEKLGKIDPLSNLNGSKVFVWSGTDDEVVPTSVTKRIGEFYEYFTPSSNIRIVTMPAGHVFPTDNFGPKCPLPSLRFVGNCEFAGAYEMLSTLLGPSVKKPGFHETLKTNPLIYFNQSEFTEPHTPKSIGLDDTGYYYLPSKCRGQDAVRCPLHIFFHGCTLGGQNYQPIMVDKIGLLLLAEVNSIVMLFPRAAKIPFVNPLGCWDVYGGHNDNFATKDAVQITAIRKMIAKLFGEL